MAARESRMLALGTPAPDFALTDATGKRFALRDFAGSKGLLVAFICNHCPFVKHLLEGFVAVCARVRPQGHRHRRHQPQRWRRVPGGQCAEHGAGRGPEGVHLPLPHRRDAGGGEGVPGDLHAGLLPLRRRPASSPTAASSMPAGRATARRPSGSDLRAAADALLAASSSRSRPRASAAASSGSQVRRRSGREASGPRPS